MVYNYLDSASSRSFEFEMDAPTMNPPATKPAFTACVRLYLLCGRLKNNELRTCEQQSLQLAYSFSLSFTHSHALLLALLSFGLAIATAAVPSLFSCRAPYTYRATFRAHDHPSRQPCNPPPFCMRHSCEADLLYSKRLTAA